MKKIIFALIVSINLFAGSNPCNKLYKLNTAVSPNPLVENLTPCAGTQSCSIPDEWQCSYNKFIDWSTPTQGVAYGGGYKWNATRSTYQLSVVTLCPDGTEPNVNNICETPPPPPICSWVKQPPWIGTIYSQIQCHNGNKTSGPNTDYLSYLWNFRWCEANQKCYGLEYYCPKGQVWGQDILACRDPKPWIPDCGTCGTYKVPGSITGPAGKMCYVDYICKCDASVRKRVDVSCGFSPLHEDPEDPLHPTEDPTPQKPDDNKQKGDICNLALKASQASCLPPKILNFSCDPRSGTATSTCTDPVVPEQTPITPEDSTNNSTSEDIKELGNKLPSAIRDALKDYLTDGSQPYLNSIKGSLQSQLKLDEDRNDKLDVIAASSDASLVLQFDSNEQLAGIKGALDGIKNSSDSGKTDNDFNGFADNNNFNDPDESSRNGIFDEIKNFSNQLVSDATSISTQFETAKSSIQSGFQPVKLPVGACVDIQFEIPGSSVPNTIPISRVPVVIAPYSPIFSLLVYATVMFFIFKFLFLFFISRSK